ncbi:MAG: metal ABC transporter substrate-binding protein [Oscillospiraceae bacterium]|nr:metal ABC transporter substrate-binding protein [Oscillospiraceae bacterium]
MKRYIAIVLALVFLVSTTSSCLYNNYMAGVSDIGQASPSTTLRESIDQDHDPDTDMLNATGQKSVTQEYAEQKSVAQNSAAPESIAPNPTTHDENQTPSNKTISQAISKAPSVLASVNEGKRLSIVCTTFPQYDWVRQILGNRVSNTDLVLLLNNGVDLHSFQPSVNDIVKISNCDLFIYVGGKSDSWVQNALRQATNPDMVVISLMNVQGDAAQKEKYVEGMEENDYHDDQNEGNEDEYDEHVWLSLRNAVVFCVAITDALSSLDPGNATEYGLNMISYLEGLYTLDAMYGEAVDSAPVKTLLFGDRFPFRYLADDYGLSYYAAFSGCSAETEASFRTVVFLSGKVNELGLKNVLVTESANQSIARTIISNTTAKNQQILVMNSMQSVSVDDVQNGATYLSIMEYNYNVLKEALS